LRRKKEGRFGCSSLEGDIALFSAIEELTVLTDWLLVPLWTSPILTRQLGLVERIIGRFSNSAANASNAGRFWQIRGWLQGSK